VDQIIQGAESHRFFPQVGEGHTYQLHYYPDCETDCSRTLLHPYSSLHFLLFGYYTTGSTRRVHLDRKFEIG